MITITKQTLEEIIAYYEMYGVTEMQYEVKHLPEILESFGAIKVELKETI